MVPILVVIPTHKRSDLLDRLLHSLARCRLPQNIAKIIVAENGIRSGADVIVKKYTDQLPLSYQFTEKPNKSNALNEILRKASDEFIVFFDDDVRVHPEILVNYEKEVGERSNGFFLCGRVYVEYEEHPIPWIIDYLPSSAKGWHFNDEKCEIKVPDGVGSNWGAFATDLKGVGGFDERRGPGSGARGQEKDMMEKLINRNIVGYYLPECKVWHFVPKNDCSPEWMLSRTYQEGIGRGIKYSRAAFRSRAKRTVISLVKVTWNRLMIKYINGRLEDKTRFHYNHKIMHHSGILRGMKGAHSGKSIVRET